MRKKIVYVAGPYTKPDPCINTNLAIKAADKLFDAGFIPFVPHLFHFWHTITPRPYQHWTEMDFAFLPLCDLLLRLPGESSGADAEIRAAHDHKIQVYTDMDLLIEVESNR